MIVLLYFNICLVIRLGVTDNGELCEICPYTFVVQPAMNINYFIDDIVVYENNKTIIELLVLTAPNSSGTRAMKIVEYPCK